MPTLPTLTPPFTSLSGIRRQVSLPVGRRPITVDDILNVDEDESEEDEQVLEAENICSADPETLAINAHMSQVAADCVCWLIRRLGPVLTTRYIAKPLLENLYRCFMGILHLRGRGTMALKCLSAIARLYGDAIILRLYLPHVENLVSWASWVSFTLLFVAGFFVCCLLWLCFLYVVCLWLCFFVCFLFMAVFLYVVCLWLCILYVVCGGVFCMLFVCGYVFYMLFVCGCVFCMLFVCGCVLFLLPKDL